MTEERLNRIKSKLRESDVEYADANGTPQIVVSPLEVLEVCEILKDDEEISFDLLADEFGVDRFQKVNRFEVICNIFSTKFRDRIFVKIKLDSKVSEMPSLTPVWTAANWHERETYDMFGINFVDHPDLRRMYMPEEFEYHPLRKDFPLMGIPGSIPLPHK